MNKYFLSDKDLDKNYFHFTKIKNIKTIEGKGLLPKIMFHAKYLEDTKKVFFVEGLDNLLILFDCWIHVVSKYPLIPGAFFIGTKIKGNNIFSKTFINLYFKWTNIFIVHKFIAYKYFDWFLKNYALLNVNIIENVDFDLNDIDQIKAKKYSENFLIKGGYSPKYSDLKSNKMDKWNLHTFSNHGISSDKIKMCYVNKSCKLIDILKYATDHTKLDLKYMCPVLWKYLQKRNIIKNINI